MILKIIGILCHFGDAQCLFLRRARKQHVETFKNGTQIGRTRHKLKLKHRASLLLFFMVTHPNSYRGSFRGTSEKLSSFILNKTNKLNKYVLFP
jgi:hypothetical protein